MLSQEYVRLPELPPSFQWSYLTSLEDLVILWGTDQKTLNVYVGIRGKHVLWIQKSKANVPGMLLRLTRFGTFSESSGIVGMVQGRGNANCTDFRLLTFDDGLYTEPRESNESWTTLPSLYDYHLLPLKAANCAIGPRSLISFSTMDPLKPTSPLAVTVVIGP